MQLMRSQLAQQSDIANKTLTNRKIPFMKSADVADCLMLALVNEASNVFFDVCTYQLWCRINHNTPDRMWWPMPARWTCCMCCPLDIRLSTAARCCMPSAWASRASVVCCMTYLANAATQVIERMNELHAITKHPCLVPNPRLVQLERDNGRFYADPAAVGELPVPVTDREAHV